MKKYFLAAVLMITFAGIAGAQTSEKAKTKNGVAKTTVKSPAAPTGIKTAGMQTGEKKTAAVKTKEKAKPGKTTTITKSPAGKHRKAKRKPKKKN